MSALLAVATVGVLVAVVACVPSPRPTSEDLVGTWYTTDHSAVSSFELKPGGQALLSNVPPRAGETFERSGSWLIRAAGDKLWLYNSVGDEAETLIIQSGIGGLSLLLYACDPDQPDCEYTYFRH